MNIWAVINVVAQNVKVAACMRMLIAIIMLLVSFTSTLQPADSLN